MSEEPDVDVEELRGELEQIKEAMGIQERYDGATSMWLFFGLAVPVAAGLSQYVLFERLPQWYFTIIWTVVLGGSFVVYVVLSDADRPDWSDLGAKPNLFVQFAIVYLATIPLQQIAFGYAGDLEYVAESGMAISIILVMLGVAYGVMGTSMRAYHVRRRDRFLFYLGTIWMVGLAVAISVSPMLESWAYAAFGGIYFAYAMGSHAVMRSGGEDS